MFNNHGINSNNNNTNVGQSYHRSRVFFGNSNSSSSTNNNTTQQHSSPSGHGGSSSSSTSLLPITTTTTTTRSGGQQSVDILKLIVLFCLIALFQNTMKMIPYVQSILDNNCCGRSIPIVSRSMGHTQDRKVSNNNDVTSSSAVVDCWKPEPVNVNITKQVDSDVRILEHPTSTTCNGRLKRESLWKNGYELLSDIAKEIELYQTNCTLPIIQFELDNICGIGSHIHIWSQALCNTHELNYRLQTYNPNWLWLDEIYCNNKQENYISPWLCYFPSSENRCNNNDNKNEIIITNVTLDPRNDKKRCNRMKNNVNNNKNFISEYRAGTTEYMFHNINPIIVQEAERQINILFPNGIIPDDIITVHIRYGDKFFEMDLVPIDEYINAIKTILIQRYNNVNNNNVNNNTILSAADDMIANIYLATEDPNVVNEFINKVPKLWNVYIDRTINEINPYRPKKGNRASWASKHTKGRAGLLALSSLLIALEANYYILTTGSNFSRLINELRINVINPRCNNCTLMIDLRPGEW